MRRTFLAFLLGMGVLVGYGSAVASAVGHVGSGCPLSHAP
jgi:hypothetical protein